MLKSLTTIAALLLLMGCARYEEAKAREGCQKAYPNDEVAADKCFETSIRESEEPTRGFLFHSVEIPNALGAPGCADGGAALDAGNRNGADRLSIALQRRHVPPPQISVKTRSRPASVGQ